MVGANVLSDSTGFATDHVGLPQRIQKRGLPVIDMAHHGDHRRPRNQILITVLGADKTFLHIGFTGTQICADPVRKVYTVLLTNRVYPTAANIKIEVVRRLWNDEIVKILGDY